MKPGAAVIGDGDVVEPDEARAGDVLRGVLVLVADVKEDEIGIPEMLREPGRADDEILTGAGGSLLRA